MGTGSVTLLWYVACLLTVGFIVATALGIMWYAKRQERKKRQLRAARRAAKKAAREAAPGSGEDPTAPASP